MIKIRLDLSSATKTEYDADIASRLRTFIQHELANDLSGCEVLVESSGPHNDERGTNKQKADPFDPDGVIGHQVHHAIEEYQRAFTYAHRLNWWHRTLCWLGCEDALANELLVRETRAHTVAFCGQSSAHKMALERVVRINSRMAKRFELESILTESNQLP
ncbi:hypothetical protein A7D21_28520 [Pseudomonas sp. AP19]|uniref:hypothetical protein n=1 Tax=Pseudomonas TaxID=286 RepID=UPI00084AED5E|nr:hypothetical protein [Pseudomonas sp. AP19]OEC63828.1 hypothetical protein A7D21_28520 [Pseudomonas sp. AP19]